MCIYIYLYFSWGFLCLCHLLVVAIRMPLVCYIVSWRVKKSPKERRKKSVLIFSHCWSRSKRKKSDQRRRKMKREELEREQFWRKSNNSNAKLLKPQFLSPIKTNTANIQKKRFQHGLTFRPKKRKEKERVNQNITT